MLFPSWSCAHILISVCYVFTLNVFVSVSARGAGRGGRSGSYGGDYNTDEPDIGQIIGFCLIGIIAILTFCYCFRKQIHKRCKKKKASQIAISPSPAPANPVQMQASPVSIVVEHASDNTKALEVSTILEVNSSMEVTNTALFQRDIIPYSIDELDGQSRPYKIERKDQLPPLYPHNGVNNATLPNTNNEIVTQRTSGHEELTPPTNHRPPISPPIYDVTDDTRVNFLQWRFY